jgi:DNA-binding transcriptional LysR family regulator
MLQRKEEVSLRSLWMMQTISEEGSINRAAKRVNLSQPALTKALLVTESNLGVRLFERAATGVSTTAEAERLMVRIRRSRRYLEGMEPWLEQKAAAKFSWQMSRRHLQAVIETAEQEAFAAAGRVLGISGSAVERSVRELELTVGRALFHRNQQRLIPTDIGEAMIRCAKLALTELRFGIEEIHEARTGAGARVAIGCLPHAQQALAPRTIALLNRSIPQLRIAIIDGVYPRLLKALRCGDIDLLVGVLRDPAPVSDVVEEILFYDPLWVLCGSGHHLANRRKLTMADCAKVSWVIPPKGTPTRELFETRFEQAGLTVPERLVECSSITAQRALLIDSEHLTLTSPSRFRLEIDAGLVKRLPIQLHDEPRPIGITTRKNFLPTAAIGAVIEALRSVAATTASEKKVSAKRS